VDELVLRGMAKWPNVPAVFGWLELDRRGNWLIKGEKISNPVVIGFIARNYDHDEHGRWFFQNGPQRVYVRLHYTPIIYRAVNDSGSPLMLKTHTGKSVVTVSGVWLDENGALLISTEHGSGALHDGDSQLALGAFRDDIGTPLADQRLEELMQHVQSGGDGPLCLSYGDQLIHVRFLPSQRVAECLNFSPCPAPLGAPESSC
jgi:DUF2946 family protein